MGSAGTVDIRALIDEGRFSGLQRITFALCFAIVLLDGFDTAAIGYIAPSLITEWGGVTRPALAPVLSAALFGLAFGALSAGPLADRFGRKAVLVASVVELSLACLVSAFTGDLTQLVILRFLTGLGLGAAMPNAVTLTSEYCPASRRAFLTNMMFSGFPLGAAFGGFLAAWMIPLFGWRSVLVFGGVVPLVLALTLVVALPESLRYLVAKGAPAERIRKIVRHLAPEAAGAAVFTLGEPQAAPGAVQEKSGLALVLSPAYRVGSVMLWVTYFCGLVIFYALINWMPILFRDAGVDPRNAALAAALFPLGGVGAIVLGLLMDRFNPNVMVAAGFLATAAAVALIGQAGGHLGLLMVTVFVAGTLMNTAQSSLPALAAGFYPTQGRATGVSWMLGLGRFGGIAGSFMVAQLAGLSLPTIFSVVAIPALVAAAALVVKFVAHPHTAQPAVTLEPVH
ncbi:MULTISPECIES: MFS transporter [Methylobacterium]|uniref:MFS transporter n=1 Tax=Methylobacterium TaxID=407 RepID=UPI0039A6CD46